MQQFVLHNAVASWHSSHLDIFPGGVDFERPSMLSSLTLGKDLGQWSWSAGSASPSWQVHVLETGRQPWQKVLQEVRQSEEPARSCPLIHTAQGAIALESVLGEQDEQGLHVPLVQHRWV